ncbi:transposase [Micromonospora soli]|uniref:RNA-guided endonuclease InsQ/TnpB family protein n=1 Tax=Micromonospora sp. NBRC 110009 TaxID=3061627 RepID=UPI002672618A|nr:transposase [Micromonospora sp. NBRC 110009]WKT99048.1 transposase [Micromonospora sp. NBRC 110009]
MVHRTARVALRVTMGQRRRCFGLLRSAGDVWACLLEINTWRRRRQAAPLVSYQELCRELAASGPGTFGELDTTGARSVLRRFSDAWFAAAKRRKDGELSARFPRRRRRLMPVRWYHGTFSLDGRRVRIPVAKGASPLWVRLAREVPYPVEQVRSITLLCEGGRLFLDVTAEVPVASYPPGEEPAPDLVAGVDLGIIHPYAVAGPGGGGLLVSGRAIRAEHRVHLADTKARRRAMAGRAPKPGQQGSRRWRKYRRRARMVEGRHRRRVRQAQHEAARQVVSWAVAQRVGVLHVGDPRGVLGIDAGRRHNLRLRQWQIGRLLQVLNDKAVLAGITVHLVDERGTSSTCPACRRRVPKPPGRTLSCPHCAFSGHRDLVAAAIIATRSPGGGPTTPTPPVVVPEVVTHRRAGRHLPGAGQSRRDPRRPTQATRGSVGPRRPAPPPGGESLAHGEDPQPAPDTR